MRFNPFELTRELIESNYKIPIPREMQGPDNQSDIGDFMTARDSYIPLGELLNFLLCKIEIAFKDAPLSHRNLFFKYHHESENQKMKMQDQAALIREAREIIMKLVSYYDEEDHVFSDEYYGISGLNDWLEKTKEI